MPRWTVTSRRSLVRALTTPRWAWILNYKRAMPWLRGGSRGCPPRWRWAKYHMKMNNLINLLIIKSIGGKMADYNTLIQIHSKIRYLEGNTSMAMTCFRTWPWVITRIEKFWVVEPKKIQMRWTLRACSRRAPRTIRVWMCPYLPVTLHHGKYNLNHRSRLYLKYRRRSIRSSRGQSDSSRRCPQHAWCIM